MASKGEAQNTRYESKTQNRTHEVTENTKHRIGTADSIASRSKSRVSSRSSHSNRAESTMQRGDSKHNQSKKSGSIVKPPAKCPPPKSVDREQSTSTKSHHKKCEDEPYRHHPEKCVKPKEKWQNGLYCRDECGSGIQPKKLGFKNSRQLWCKTPLSMYQATIGELGRQILCREKIISRDVTAAPPCNVCEYIVPPCRGYYRKYDCIRPCEEEYVSYKRGKKLYRDRVERYWEPCQSQDQKVFVDINTFAHQNAYLGEKLRRKFDQAIPCW